MGVKTLKHFAFLRRLSLFLARLGLFWPKIKFVIGGPIEAFWAKIMVSQSAVAQNNLVYYTLRQCDSTVNHLEQYGTVHLLSLDGDGSFRANRESETIKTVGE